MKCLNWNVEGLTLEKKSSTEFIEILKGYDIICLSETWTNKSSNIDLMGYTNPIHSYRRLQHRNAKRKGVKLLKNEIDCLILLSVSNYFFIY